MKGYSFTKNELLHRNISKSDSVLPHPHSLCEGGSDLPPWKEGKCHKKNVREGKRRKQHFAPLFFRSKGPSINDVPG